MLDRKGRKKNVFNLLFFMPRTRRRRQQTLREMEEKEKVLAIHASRFSACKLTRSAIKMQIFFSFLPHIFSAIQQQKKKSH